ncbi:MAG: squalene/phytoene synthase family protein [Pseudomonadota bacterium]|nr:squalene/phytoene synthase family protein [Pseudomonadota bacterium]
MRPALKTLDTTYRARAIPAGSARYWSWLFAAAPARPPLLGIYALLAEWNALMDPATEHSAAQIKLAWWQEEIRRLAAGVPVHPVGIYLASLPRAGEVDFARLAPSIDAAVVETNGAPLERAAELEPHAHALRAPPLALASRLVTEGLDDAALAGCTQALAVADYIARATRDYRRDVQLGRTPFPVDELLTAGIDNTDLRAERAPPPLQNYLAQLRQRAREHYETAARALPLEHRSQLRHLLVLGALGLKHLLARTPTGTATGLQDLLLAWSTARRA